MITDLKILPTKLTDGSEVFAVEYFGFVNGFNLGHKIKFHCVDEKAAQRLFDALDGISGCEVSGEVQQTLEAIVNAARPDNFNNKTRVWEAVLPHAGHFRTDLLGPLFDRAVKALGLTK